MLQTTEYIVDGLQVVSHSFKEKVDTSVEVNYFFQDRIEIVCHFNDEKKSYAFQFIYNYAYLQRFESAFQKPFSLLKSKSVLHNEMSVVCCKLKDVFQQLAINNHRGVFNTIFIESQALLVLLHTHNTCDEEIDTPCYNCKFLNIPTEKQKIMQARVILMINLSEPPTIPQLARAVHINDCYLKKGFKEMFGCAIFDFIQQEKIKKAKQLLRQNAHSIQHIALELGYSNTSNFTNAFKKMTSLAPSEWQKNFLGSE